MGTFTFSLTGFPLGMDFSFPWETEQSFTDPVRWCWLFREKGRVCFLDSFDSNLKT